MADDISPKGIPVVVHAYDGADLRYIDWDTIEALKTALEKIDNLQGALDSQGTDEIDVNVELSVLPTGAATETTLDEIMDRLGDESSPAAGSVNDQLADILTALQIIDGYAHEDNVLFGVESRWFEDMGGSASADLYSAATTAVPSGYIYVLQGVSLRSNSRDTTNAEIQVDESGGVVCYLEFLASLTRYDSITWFGSMVLGEGDRVHVRCSGNTAGDTLVGAVRGYKMKI